MDRSFLSRTDVVAASRDFVCARLLTYESAPEAKVLTSFFVGRSGDLENTTFAVLAADGKTMLTRGGRSPEIVFGGSSGPGASGDAGVKAMVGALGTIATKNPAKKESAAESPTMPYVVDVRRGLDVAACDMLPLAVLLAKDDATLVALEKTLRPLAWADDVRGRFTWAHATDAAAIAEAKGVPAGTTLVVLKPDAFGLKGTILAQTDKTDAASLRKVLDTALAKHDPGTKDARQLINEGHREGVHWDTEIPVTDPGPPGGPRPK